MEQMNEGRIPPHSLEAEKSVLGAAMLSEEALGDVAETVRPDDFYDKNHKEIFEAILDLNRKSLPVDVLTVSEELKKRGSLNMVGGRAYVASLSSSTPTTSNAPEYARIVSEKAAIRRLIAAADGIVDKGYDGGMAASQMIDFAEREIFEISQSRQKGKYTHIQEALLSNLDAIDKASQMEDGLTGITTGFADLDAKTSGLQKSDLIILAARPAMGKTAFALSLARNAAVKGNASVMIFSMEMAKEQLSQRLLSMESKVELQKLKKGNLDRRDWEDINIAMDVLSGTNIHIDDTAGISIMEMKSKCRRLKAEKGLDLVVIDYLQLMNPEGKADSRTQEISVLSRNLKLLARELDCPVLVLSQLSRAPETRTDHRPMLSDLRESGSIEQDADIVIFLYRDEYYNKENTEKPGECEVIVAKHRSGPTGTIDVSWIERYTQFKDKASGTLPTF
ncbi:MAG: replicative DNA helicase [Clostridiales bacterium]|nr:replicative DNA helicase [Clostridiales bacterium]MDD6539343.1 replicative DNA helicase [Bacillota bacterium]MDD7016549.1 replicative DNA helicase [Bacillota bacterium]MDY4960038.1 replicative DNA helicase [Lentihominibacter sp.]